MESSASASVQPSWGVKPNHSSIADYIPLGCLCLFPSGHTSQRGNRVWLEVLTCDSFLPPDLHFVVKLHAARWIKLFRQEYDENICLRVYLLPDDIRLSSVDRQSKTLRADLGHLCSRLDTSIEAWNGSPNPATCKKFDLWATGVNRSLFWLFNSLPSPNPNPYRIPDRYSRSAAENVLSKSGVPCSSGTPSSDSVESIPDLKATLYPYQARTAAAMIERETLPSTNLDPRFEERTCPTGSKYYYNPRALQFRLSPPQYEGSRGGILAESMGVGKTVIIIALILATRYHLPRIPPQYSTSTTTRPRICRLADMVIACAGRSNVPLKSHMHFFRRGLYPHLEAKIDAIPTTYEIPYSTRRSSRTSIVVPPPKRVRLCSTSIVVVPRNLFRQWQAELNKHANLSSGGLRVLFLEKSKDRLPDADEIATYDILLFSKTRFEQEAKDGQDDKGRTTSNVRAGCQCPYIGATRIRDCSCLRPEDIYQSPLKKLHFLRIVIDEGHEFTSSSSNAVRVATTLVQAERRWIVSGTPAKERLFGVDVELAGNLFANDEEQMPEFTPVHSGRFGLALQSRKSYIRQEELNGASKSIGVLLSNFLQVRPWAGNELEPKSEWEDFAFRHETFKGRTHSAFSQCMVSTLNTLVLKTRPEDIERDVLLPPLHASVKMLKPCYYDIITLNLFNFFILANAVTSERTDVDYLFHKNSTASRHSLVRNLRASPFFWTGWTESDVVSAIGHSERYLCKEGTSCSMEDREQLSEGIRFARRVLESPGWKAMSQTHEIALYVENWPDEYREPWSLDGGSDPIMVGASQLHAAQRFVNEKLFDPNPIENLAALGSVERKKAFTVEEDERRTKAKEGTMTKMGVPVSGMREKQFDSRQHASPKKGLSKTVKVSDVQGADDLVETNFKRKRLNAFDDRELPSDSPLAAASVIGTVSSKLSYLLGRVIELHVDEKILIFYDADNAAWYISQVLDLFHVKHLIYARHLNVEQRSKYIVAFDTDDSIRVLLMDITHGAWGLNVNKASRVFFLNPPMSPHTEAQAIKRAHRIGQTKAVYVETLVLEGTIEEAMFKRSKAMTREEHDNAGKEISNDSGVAKIIQSARSIPLPDDARTAKSHMAPLKVPLQVFGRKGRHDIKIKGIDAEEGEDQARPKRKKAKKSGFTSPETERSESMSLSESTALQPSLNLGSIFG
ncbi:uncharacterized protein PV09_05429 [Verruconis gallopava]|uniref:Helicase C-terminal domain-containing protein n=1 Tax=Verruconis gallopava TaxID=253628 RepID=A0A0D2A8W7_9PEZI|nr:uncharacterized protein PV09_05429 [Verruconis gallopava]KIW03203.1 hypothetical protein PV09_05429 [Verruconis gallopava]